MNWDLIYINIYDHAVIWADWVYIMFAENADAI